MVRDLYDSIDVRMVGFLSRGYTQKEAAAELGYSRSTVKRRLSYLMVAFRAGNTTELAAKMIRRRLL